jgi:hypothetical protein
LSQRLFEKLSAGDLDDVIKICDKYSNLFGTTQFFDNLLKPIMYDIGKLWAEGKLDIATEHVSVNTANTLIKIINKRHCILIIRIIKKERYLSVPLTENNTIWHATF